MAQKAQQSPEVMLLAGPPWCGKSTLAEKVIELAAPMPIRHLSIGNLKRSIVAGETPSKYAALLQGRQQGEQKRGAALGEFRTGLPDQVIPQTAIMTGIVEEFILEQPQALTIVDGFPRYQNGVRPFMDSMANIGANVLSLCIVAVPEATLRERSAMRPTRAHQDPAMAGEAYVSQRLADHAWNVVPTLGILATEYPTLIIDGLLPVEEKAEQMLEVYARLSAQAEE